MGASIQVERAVTDPKWFRQVLGQYPTGVCVISATDDAGRTAGMAVGSFTSVSLEPPLVAFLPDRSSSSWPKIRDAGRFCVNVLASDQEAVCRQFSSKMPDKFAGLRWQPSALGNPVLDGCVAWIDCELSAVHEAGDHYIVIGLVRQLQVASGGLPLLFFQGGYGKFSPLSMSAPDPLGELTTQLRHVDIARPEMEALAAELNARCIATAPVDNELVVAASAGSSRRGGVSTLVGQRLPFMPPTSAVFAAWSSDATQKAWLSGAPLGARERQAAALATVRERGFSVGLLNDTQRVFASALDALAAGGAAAQSLNLRDMVQGLSYDPLDLCAENLSRVRLISAPVFGPDGNVLFALTLYEFPKPPAEGVRSYIDRVLLVTRRITRLLGGVVPEHRSGLGDLALAR
jgi:flavin reductase (DIM6/NTAB) family NADH-FMN oxidoreductase RutF/DNA-binding IclR family transcriptional regulator